MNIGSKIPTDNLVFGYDTGYPLVSGSSDTYKFNKGEPTENLASNPTFTSTANWALASNGGGTFSVSDGYGKITAGSVGSYSYLYKVVSATVASNESITWSVGFKNNVVGDYGIRIVLFLDGGVKTQPVIYFSLDGTGGIIRKSVTTSHPDGANSIRIDIMQGSYYSNIATDTDVEFTNALLERKSHATPFTTGTRSVSGSLIDLTRTYDIDLSNVSFDSNAQTTFDGTDDFIELNATLSDLVGSTPSGITFEFVAKADDLTNPIGISGDYTGPAGTGFGIKRSSSNNKLEFRVYATGGIPRSTTDIPTDSYFYGACVWDGTGTGEHRIYFNGVLETTDTSAGTTWNHASGDLRVGDIYNSMGVPGEWQGEIPLFRLYNKALTNKEVAQNFNAIRERFNI